jgi:hypothetical protein
MGRNTKVGKESRKKEQEKRKVKKYVRKDDKHKTIKIKE